VSSVVKAFDFLAGDQNTEWNTLITSRRKIFTTPLRLFAQQTVLASIYVVRIDEE
jgi:hypothetical protein